MSEEELQIDFDFVDPSDSHFHMLKYFLEILFGRKECSSSIDSSKLAQTIIDQSSRFGICFQVASDSDEPEHQEETLKDEEEKQIFGFSALLPLTDQPELLRFLVSKVSHKVSSRDVVVLNERMLNVPYTISKYLCEFMLSDLKGESFDRFIIISKITNETDDDDNADDLEEESSNSKRGKKKSKKSKKQNAANILPENVEENHLEQVIFIFISHF